MGALMLTDLMSKVKTALKLNGTRLTYWTDSSVVLGWLSTEPTKLQTFVGNRVAKILEQTRFDEWRYVPTNDNPADPVSWGVDARDLSSLCKYWSGPDWLAKNENIWPVREFRMGNIPEIKKNVLTIELNNHSLIEFSRFSSLERLQRTFAYVLRQHEAFAEELENLDRGKNIPKKESIIKFKCVFGFLEVTRIIRLIKNFLSLSRVNMHWVV
ncbi:uncharacterized protein [Onthophagus taurus]|uniref:uncharacterized protein n=1 Tax=Onthophagus taurus TaxID=166361 RepID=UPI0039BEC4F7